MRFRPALATTLGLLAVAAACTRLGAWQLERAAEKQATLDAFAAAPALPLDQALRSPADWSRVRVQGRFDARRHLLLDNQLHEGRAGVHVFTPFQVDDRSWLMVNRGWLPLADRRRLPAVDTPTDTLTLHGRLAPPPVPGRQLGEADRLAPDRWPQLVTYYRPADVSAALGETLPRRVLWLDADAPAGFQARDWQPVAMPPRRHVGYAVQWFALALTALVIWVVLGVRRGRPEPRL